MTGELDFVFIFLPFAFLMTARRVRRGRSCRFCLAWLTAWVVAWVGINEFLGLRTRGKNDCFVFIFIRDICLPFICCSYV